MALPATGFSLAKFVTSSPGLLRMIQPIANAYANATGHRKFGLRYDDIIEEENPIMQKALGRLSERESYDRAFRMKQAIHLSALHRELPREKWLKAEEDVRYLTPLVEEASQEAEERAKWDTVKVKKTH